MGYVAVGIGQTEIRRADLIACLLAGYAASERTAAVHSCGKRGGPNPGQKPVPPAAIAFPVPPGAKRPIVDQIEVAQIGAVPVGVAGVVGKAAPGGEPEAEVGRIARLPQREGCHHRGGAGTREAPAEAATQCAHFPGAEQRCGQGGRGFPAISGRPLSVRFGPAAAPAAGGGPQGPPASTLIVQVRHRGQHVGVLGAFKEADGSFDLKYQLVPLGEEYITPGTEEQALKTNKRPSRRLGPCTRRTCRPRICCRSTRAHRIRRRSSPVPLHRQ